MNRVALYRKYRPQNFDNLIGQEHVHDTLRNALKNDRVAQAYLFAGPRGTGKTTSARLVAKALNCGDLQNGFEPCDKCEFCVDINEGKLIDLIEIDAASNRGIDEVRDLNEKIMFAPTRGKCKVYIVDEVHMMTKEAFNALLKTLEEPPEHAYFILATTEVHKIPDTIISRCQRFDFRRLSEKAIMARLSFIAQNEKFEADEKALEAIAHYVEGGMRDAIGLLEQLVVDGKLTFEHVQEILGISDHSLLEKLYVAVLNNDTQAGLRVIHGLHDQGSDLRQFLHEFVDLLRQKMLSAVNKNEDAVVARVLEVIAAFQEAQEKVSFHAIPQLPMEIAVVKTTKNLKKVVKAVEAVPEAIPEPVVEKVEKPVAVEKKQEEAAAPAEAVAETVEEAAAEPVVITNEPAPNMEMSIAEFKNNWPRVTERITTPSLRMSLKTAVPSKLAGVDLTLQFGTNFHKDKIMENENRVEVEQVLKEVFKHGFKIHAEVKPLEMKAVVHEDPAPPPPMPPEMAQSSAPAPAQTSVDAALDIFGGELVD